jgi:RNA polymerase sigma factor (sigma-70 family)
MPMEANFEKSPMPLSFPESGNPSDFGLISPKRLIHFIVQHPDDQKAWNEFFRRYHQHIGQTVYKAVRRYGHSDGVAIVEDLVQEVYKKLVAENCRALRVFKSEAENGIFKYLQIIAIRIVLNEITRNKAQKIIPLSKKSEDSEIDKLLPPDWRDKTRYDDLVAEIETCLEKILQGRRHANRDRLIIRYYLFDELKPDEIVSITPLETPSAPVDLSLKRVSNIIGELLKKLRNCMEKTRKS